MSSPNLFIFSFLSFTKFDPNDPRYPYRITEKVPLLNFCMFEATQSHPTVYIFSEAEVRSQLHRRALAYVQEIPFDRKRKAVYLSRFLV